MKSMPGADFWKNASQSRTVDDPMTDEPKRLLSIGEQDHCLNCGAARDAIYCGQCGQRFIDARLSVRGIQQQ